jgi:hypothetical protein
MAANRKYLLAFPVIIFLICSFSQNSFSEIYQWEDCTKSFKKQITTIVKPRPADVEVNLPELVKKYNTIPLVITVDHDSVVPIQRGYLTVNNQPKNSAYWFHLHTKSKKTVRINIHSKFLTAGTNTLKFRSDKYRKSHHGYNILQLQFDFSGMEDITAYFAQKSTAKQMKSHESMQPLKKTAKDITPPEIVITSHDISRGIKPLQNQKKVRISGRAYDENGIVEITVNNKDATFDEAGNFETDVYLKMGKNRIVVNAMDIYENHARKEFTISRVASMVPSKTKDVNATTGNYYALVVGNNNYKYMKKLQTAKNDAMKVAEILKNRYGFDIKLLLDADRDAILDAVNDFRRILKQDDQFLIYYAGHGSFDKIAGKAYWLPIDAQKNNDKNWIIVDTITSNIKRISSNHVLIVADSCYSGTFTRTSSLAKLASAQKRRVYLKKMHVKKSRTLLASGGNEPVSDIGGEENSVFAKAFLVGLTNMDLNEFTAEELYIQYIKEMVAGSSDQTPEYNIIRNSGHEGGDFVFRKKLASLEQERFWEDEKILITLDKMEIADNYPAEVKKTMSPRDRLRQPKRGYKYAFFLMTMDEIKDVHVVSLGGKSKSQSTLSCAAGNKYKLSMWTVKGIRISDPTNLASPSEFAEGAKILLVFTILKDEKPDKLSFVYYFKKQLKDSSMKKGKLEMQL